MLSILTKDIRILHIHMASLGPRDKILINA